MREAFAAHQGDQDVRSFMRREVQVQFLDEPTIPNNPIIICTPRTTSALFKRELGSDGRSQGCNGFILTGGAEKETKKKQVLYSSSEFPIHDVQGFIKKWKQAECREQSKGPHALCLEQR